MSFELCLFSVDPNFVKAGVSAGIDTIIVDWENQGKKQRQYSYDTQINHHSAKDLDTIRKATGANIICRINMLSPYSQEEVERAIALGADEVLVPMIRSLEDVYEILHYVNGRAAVGILIETKAAINIALQLGQLPLKRVYVGLNDLAIEQQDSNIFLPFANGLLDQVRKCIPVSFGVGGLTSIDKGDPIPCSFLIEELMRLQCNFSFLRRSFLRDVQEENLSFEIGRLREGLAAAQERTFFQIELAHQNFVQLIESLGVPLI